LSPPAYWSPVHYPVSAWTTHAPFASWLVDALRPSSIVELGTHYGYSCFAFAEAAKRLGLHAVVSAIDTWEGDDHAGFYGEEVFRYVESVVRSDYPESVRLVRSRFDQVRDSFADASTDILHIDGRHGYDDARADYAGWVTAVRDGGVVLFHDIAERSDGFGVWRLWEEIAEPGRSFMFEHGHGLGVLGVGEPTVLALRALFSADADTARRIRSDFSRLGGLVARQARATQLERDLETARAQARHLTADVEECKRRVEGLFEVVRAKDTAIRERDERIQAILDSTSWRVTKPLRVVGRVLPRSR